MICKRRCDFGFQISGRAFGRVGLAAVVFGFALLIAAPGEAQVTVPAGFDAFKTDPPTTVDLPPLPADFFGPGSDPFAGAVAFPLDGHPYPDRFGVPAPFPPSELLLDITWFDRHVSVVSADSQHKVSERVKVIEPDPPYNFDTIIRRKSATFDAPDDSQEVEIDMIWLSLKSTAPIEVTYFGGVEAASYDVYVGLSDTTPQVAGRMGMLAMDVGPDTVLGLLDLGATGDPVDLLLESGDFTAYDQLPDALGLPVFYQIQFQNTVDPSDVIVIDDHDGDVCGMMTTSNFHNPLWMYGGGEFWYVPEPSSLILLAVGAVGLLFRRW